MKVYKEDLAYIHDVGHGDFALGSAPAILDMFRQRGLVQGLVVDLGCGSGLWAGELVHAGYQVLGIDISPAMIDLARQRVPQGDFRQGSFLEVALPSCIAVTSLGECFNYLFDAKNSKKQLAQLFRRIHKALNPGGILLFDVLEPGQLGASRVEKKHRTGDDWAVMVEMEEDVKRQELTRRITSFRKVGDLYRRDEEVHRARLYSRSDMDRELRRVGFRVRQLRGYGTQRFRRGHVGFLAHKP